MLNCSNTILQYYHFSLLQMSLTATFDAIHGFLVFTYVTWKLVLSPTS